MNQETEEIALILEDWFPGKVEKAKREALPA